MLASRKRTKYYTAYLEKQNDVCDSELLFLLRYLSYLPFWEAGLVRSRVKAGLLGSDKSNTFNRLIFPFLANHLMILSVESPGHYDYHHTL